MGVHDLKNLVKERDDAVKAKIAAQATIERTQEHIITILAEAGHYELLTINQSRFTEFVRHLP